MTDESTLDPLGTRREGDGTTNASTADGTRREGVGDGGGVVGTRREGVAGGYVRVNLPPELAASFEVLGEVASGGESDVLLVRRRDDGGRSAALKIYRHGLEPDAEALTAIRSLPREHVVEIYDCGRSSAGWWEEQEYIEHGSLAELFEREGPRLAADRLREVVVELTGALEAVHPVLHRDVKPTNVFVRTVEPLDLVLGDFGLARSTAFTHIVSTVAGSLAYQSPEALDGGASPARDWWAVGMMVAEAATGRHPFFDPELGWPPAAEMRIALTTRPVPLDGVEDERVRLLCRGLLVRDPRQRWGAAEVRSWLDGGTPAIADDSATVRVDGRAAAIQPFVFAGERCTTPEQLAPLLAQHWDDALRLISGAASEAPDYVRLAGWLEDHHHEPALRVLNASQDRSFARRLFRLLRALDPDLPPSFRGHIVDREGLLALAEAAMQENSDALSTVWDVSALGIIGDVARDDRYSDLIGVEENLRSQIELLHRLRGELGTHGAALEGEHAERAAAAAILAALLSPDALDQLRQSSTAAIAAAAVPGDDPRAHLLDRVRGDDSEPARIIATIAAAPAIGDEVAVEVEQRRAREQAEHEAAERVRREQEQAEQAERLRRTRQRTRALILAATAAGAGIALGLYAANRFAQDIRFDSHNIVRIDQVVRLIVVPALIGFSLPRGVGWARQRFAQTVFVVTLCYLGLAVLSDYQAYPAAGWNDIAQSTVGHKLVPFGVSMIVAWILPVNTGSRGGANAGRRRLVSSFGLLLIAAAAADVSFVLAMHLKYTGLLSGPWELLPYWV